MAEKALTAVIQEGLRAGCRDPLGRRPGAGDEDERDLQKRVASFREMYKLTLYESGIIFHFL